MQSFAKFKLLKIKQLVTHDSLFPSDNCSEQTTRKLLLTHELQHAIAFSLNDVSCETLQRFKGDTSHFDGDVIVYQLSVHYPLESFVFISYDSQIFATTEASRFFLSAPLIALMCSSRLNLIILDFRKTTSLKK